MDSQRSRCLGPLKGSSIPSSPLMDISWPTNVCHICHVTFDRFQGFLGLPPEFEAQIPHKPPSASTSVFGVSTHSMQCSYDKRGNSIPTILLKLQKSLYKQGGLMAEGIFRINSENCQEEHVRSQLNKGNVPQNIDVHCLAGLIKAWFRELPGGILDSLSAEQMLQCHTEQRCLELLKMLAPSKADLLDWAINLMADVVEKHHSNKMNSRNIAMVFAPNMTQMSDPLTALMHAVQVMNFLKMLTIKTLKDRKESPINSNPRDYGHMDLMKDSFPSLCYKKETSRHENKISLVSRENYLDCPSQNCHKKKLVYYDDYGKTFLDTECSAQFRGCKTRERSTKMGMDNLHHSCMNRVDKVDISKVQNSRTKPLSKVIAGASHRWDLDQKNNHIRVIVKRNVLDGTSKKRSMRPLS